MDRRSYLGALASAGAIATAGCSGLGGSETLTEPSVHTDSPSRRSVHFSSGGEEIGSFGADGSVSNGLIHLDTELWHRTGTTVQSIRLTVWMPSETNAGRETVALAAPVQGDSSPPPEITLSVDRQHSGAVVEITDLDDLRDETISTITLLVDPRSNPSTTVAIDAEIEIAESGLAGTDYTLDGRLDLDVPDLNGER